MLDINRIDEAQDAIFSMIETEIGNGYTNAIHDSYKGRNILQLCQAIESLGRIKNSLPPDDLPWVDVE